MSLYPKNLFFIFCITCLYKDIQNVKNNSKLLFSKSNELKLVFVVHRHGDRNPIFTYPTDPFADEVKYWPDDFQMLTSYGKRRMHSLGKYIRKRYKNFLGESPREVYVRSSARDRCLESISLVLAELYPPVGRWKWNSDLGRVWQPIAIHSVNFSLDGMLNPEAICPKAERDMKKIYKSKVVQNFLKRHENSLKFISEKSGADLHHYTVLRDMFNTFEIQKNNRYSLPVWVNETVYQCLEEFFEMAFQFDCSTHLQKRLRAGLLLKDISEHMKQSVNDCKPKHKIFFYSTHDNIVANILIALDIYNNRAPPYGATVFFEFYAFEGNHRIEVHYLNVTESEKTYQLFPIKCINENKMCLLDQFLSSIRDLIPSDWEYECK